MPEDDPTPAQREREVLIHEIDIHRARIPLILELADLTLERSQIIWDRIQQEIEQDRQEVEEASQILRIAGLLKD